MDYTPKRVVLKNGRSCLIRRAEAADAERMIEYLKVTSGETPYMARDPEEFIMTVEEERGFLQKMADSERELMLCAEVDGRYAGSCSFSPVAERKRLRHRCTVGISLYREFWGMGVGTALMSEALDAARAAGYEQMELDVVATNASAVALYEKLGFSSIGICPRAMRYSEGSYADLLLMVKPLY